MKRIKIIIKELNLNILIQIKKFICGPKTKVELIFKKIYFWLYHKKELNYHLIILQNLWKKGKKNEKINESIFIIIY